MSEKARRKSQGKEKWKKVQNEGRGRRRRGGQRRTKGGEEALEGKKCRG